MLPSAVALLLFLTLGGAEILLRGPISRLGPNLLASENALPSATHPSRDREGAVALLLPTTYLRGPISRLGPNLLVSENALPSATLPSRDREGAVALLLPTTYLYRLLYGPLPAAAGPVAEEYQVKGAFLLNFAKFVSWPDQAFKTPDEPISICILGQNPFGPGLEQAARDLVIGDRHVVVRPSSDVQSARQCQIVFVAASERKLAKALLQAAQGESVLTVGEFEGFTAGGGVIAFKLDGEKVRLDINTAAADRARLHISAKLLSLAQSSKK